MLGDETQPAIAREARFTPTSDWLIQSQLSISNERLANSLVISKEQQGSGAALRCESAEPLRRREARVLDLTIPIVLRLSCSQEQIELARARIL